MAVQNAEMTAVQPLSHGGAPKGYQAQACEASGAQLCAGTFLKVFFGLLIAIVFPISLPFCIRIVKEYERAVIFRLGRALPGAKGPGLFFIIPCIDELVNKDLRTISFDVPPQEILTRDSVTIAVDAVVYYRISNPFVAVCNVENAAASTRLLAATTLRNFLGTKTLSEVLSEREDISNNMQVYLDEGTDPWGVKVERVEIKDVRLPFQLQRAMATEAEAAREAKAKCVAAEGELKSSMALKEAACILAESPAAIQLRYLQTLTTIAAEKNSTIVFPLPIDLLNGMNQTTAGTRGACPKSPHAESPKSPLAESPKSPLAESPKSPLAESPKSPLAESPKSPLSEFPDVESLDIALL